MIQKVAVIGAGPAGLAAAKYLLAENKFSKIAIFEQRLNVGGVWNATLSTRSDSNFTIPQTRPNTTPDDPILLDEKDGAERRFDFLSPIYDNLDTNIPHMLMKYSDYAFPAGSSLFPQHDAVLEYLERYADEIRHLISFGVQVLEVRPSSEDNSAETWSVTVKDLKTGNTSTSIFDAVVVASGHYNDPYVPDIPGIREWNSAYPGSISHSKFYRKPEDFKDKKVLIIGNSASGTDLAAQIAPFCKPPLLISSRSPPAQSLQPSYPVATESLPEITHFNASTHSITFSDLHTDSDIDAIIFCTGYLYSFPFLSPSVFSKPPLLPLSTSSTTSTTSTTTTTTADSSSSSSPPSGTHVPNLYRHLFYRPLPTLSFLALPQRIIPFPLSEAQASVIARFLSGRLSLPSEAEMAAWETARLDEMKGKNVAGDDGEEEAAAAGEAKFHVMGFPADAEYINFLHDWAMQARPLVNNNDNNNTSQQPDKGKSSSNSKAMGKEPPYWGERELWMREQTPLIKKAARELGSARKRAEVTTLEALGLSLYRGRR